MSRPAAGVVELRAYAASAMPTGDWIAGRAAPCFTDPGATVSALAPTGSGRVASLPADEFVMVVSGSLVIEAAGVRLQVATGRSVVLPAGSSFTWAATAGTLVVSVLAPGPNKAGATAVAVDEDAPLVPSNPPLATLLVGPTPSCRNHTDFLSANGEFVCGTWDSTPYHRRTMPYRHIELMHLLEGSVTLEGPEGSSTFHTGDLFLVTRGAECAWISTVHVKKVYAIHRPA